MADEDLPAFGPMMGDYIQGREIPLQNVFLSSTEPLYHKVRAQPAHVRVAMTCLDPPGPRGPSASTAL